MKTKSNSKLQTIHTDIRLTDCINMPVNQFKKLAANKDFELMLNYPLSKEFSFTIKTGKKGLDFQGLLKKIGQTYVKVYSNTKKYGVWGHGIEDLFIEAIHVDHEKNKIKVSMGS